MADLKTPGAEDRTRGGLMALIGAAIAAIALLISIATYSNAQEEGGRYFVLVGPIALGLILFVAGLSKLRDAHTEEKPGWRIDPTGRHHRRYWDGQRWTEHVEDLGKGGVDPIEGTAHSDPASSSFST